MLAKWDKLPEQMKTEAVRRYYDALQRKRRALLLSGSSIFLFPCSC